MASVDPMIIVLIGASTPRFARARQANNCKHCSDQRGEGCKRACAQKETAMRLVRSLVTIGAICASISLANAQAIGWQKVDDAFGRKPAVVAGEVHRYGFPRTDLNVTLDGVTIKPALALGGWVALKPTHDDAMVMGDLVLLETEINPVMAKMIENGLDITAVHNHLLRADPFTCTLAVTAIQSNLPLPFMTHCR
jgi:hypothetical protein